MSNAPMKALFKYQRHSKPHTLQLGILIGYSYIDWYINLDEHIYESNKELKFMQKYLLWSRYTLFVQSLLK